jgi:large subunit ribosomal protein L15
MGFQKKKTKKSKTKRGTTTYHGARKKHKSSGHKGGKGMSGTGKRADHKKTLINALYGNTYFGKQGITSRKTEKNRDKVINTGRIESNYDNLMKKYGKNSVLHLEKYKILGDGELKRKISIKALSFSESAKKIIEKAGGQAIIVKNDKIIEKES